MEKDSERLLAQIIQDQRWACLATFNKEGPYGSYVAYVPEQDFSGFLIHISRLAPHTQNLLADARATLAISEQDNGEGDPQTLARVSIQGRVVALERDSSEYQKARAHYLQRLLDAEQLFGFSDFVLFRLMPSQARFVAGFARTWNVSAEQLQSVSRQNCPE